MVGFCRDRAGGVFGDAVHFGVFMGDAEGIVDFEDNGAAFFVGEFAFGRIGYYRLPSVTDGLLSVTIGYQR